MNVKCNSLTLDMEEDGEKWKSVIDFTKNIIVDFNINTEMNKEDATEIITIRIVRVTQASKEYAAYVNGGFLK